MAGSGYDILGVGVATVDDLLMTAQFPRPNEKRRLEAMERHCGGLTASALVAAARMNCRCGYLATLGENDMASFVRRQLRGEGIEVLADGSPPDAEPFHSVIITERAAGERSILWRNYKTLPPRIGPAELELAAACACLFVDHVFAADSLEMAAAARRAGRPVVGDFERDTPRSRELMDLTDHLILPLAHARRTLESETASPEEAASRLAGFPGRALACVTDGDRGSWYALGEAPDRVASQPCFHAGPVADSTGCGDVFHGVYAAGLVKGWNPSERIRRAAAAAALKTLKPGSQAGAPTLAELETFLRRPAGGV